MWVNFSDEPGCDNNFSLLQVILEKVMQSVLIWQFVGLFFGFSETWGRLCMIKPKKHVIRMYLRIVTAHLQISQVEKSR